MTQEALKLALEALELCNGAETVEGVVIYTNKEITAIKEALAQPEQFCDANCVWTDHHPDCKLAQPEQEPVAYLCENAVGHKYFRWKKPSSTYKPIALYTHPPQRTWVGLTDEDKKQMAKEANYHWEMTAGEYAERIGQLTEAKLKEKNNA